MLEKLKIYLRNRITSMQDDLWNGKDRDHDIYMCGVIDGEYSTLLKIADMLGMTKELEREGFQTDYDI